MNSEILETIVKTFQNHNGAITWLIWVTILNSLAITVTAVAFVLYVVL